MLWIDRVPSTRYQNPERGEHRHEEHRRRHAVGHPQDDVHGVGTRRPEHADHEDGEPVHARPVGPCTQLQSHRHDEPEPAEDDRRDRPQGGRRPVPRRLAHPGGQQLGDPEPHGDLGDLGHGEGQSGSSASSGGRGEVRTWRHRSARRHRGAHGKHGRGRIMSVSCTQRTRRAPDHRHGPGASRPSRRICGTRDALEEVMPHVVGPADRAGRVRVRRLCGGAASPGRAIDPRHRPRTSPRADPRSVPPVAVHRRHRPGPVLVRGRHHRTANPAGVPGTGRRRRQPGRHGRRGVAGPRNTTSPDRGRRRRGGLPRSRGTRAVRRAAESATRHHRPALRAPGSRRGDRPARGGCRAAARTPQRGCARAARRLRLRPGQPQQPGTPGLLSVTARLPTDTVGDACRRALRPVVPQHRSAARIGRRGLGRHDPRPDDLPDDRRTGRARRPHPIRARARGCGRLRRRGLRHPVPDPLRRPGRGHARVTGRPHRPRIHVAALSS